MCLLNKTCCSSVQDVLYREMNFVCHKACRTLSKSPHLARRVQRFSFAQLFSFATNDPISVIEALPVKYVNKSLAKGLRNMTSLRELALFIGGGSDILAGCTFKLEALSGDFIHNKSFRKFLNSQPSLTSLSIFRERDDFSDLEATRLPNLTRVFAPFTSLRYLIPGRPVSEVYSFVFADDGFSDLSFFTLSTSPILKLAIQYFGLYPKFAHLLASIFPSLTHLLIIAETETVCKPPLLLFNNWILSRFVIDRV
jgi:hypothetical protein